MDLSPAVPDRRRQGGFSLVEVLVASVILLVIALGMVPLYTRAIRSNVSGFDYTQVSNFARSRAEEFLQYPWNSPRLTLPAGETELVFTDAYSQQERVWKTPPLAAGDEELFTRVTRVREVAVTDIDTPLPGGSPAAHLKEITVTVNGTRLAGAPLGPGQQIVVQVLKSQ